MAAASLRNDCRAQPGRELALLPPGLLMPSPGCICCKQGGVLGFSYHPGVTSFSSAPTVGLWGDQKDVESTP